MYEWLKEEIAKIRTPKFHILTPSNNSIISRGLDESFPPSFIAFLSEFSEARLFHMGTYYLVNIYSSPKPAVTNSTEIYLNFGSSSQFGQAYFKRSLLAPGREAPVFEWDYDDEESVIENTTETFESWLLSRYSQAKQNYTEIEWQKIMKGPQPFTHEEEKILRARRDFKWEVVDFANNGNARIKIRNESNITLLYLSLGVRAKDMSINGIVRLPVSNINPGEEKVVECDCYKKMITPQNMQVYALEDPRPEDRELYWEFRTSNR